MIAHATTKPTPTSVSTRISRNVMRVPSRCSMSATIACSWTFGFSAMPLEVSGPNPVSCRFSASGSNVGPDRGGDHAIDSQPTDNLSAIRKLTGANPARAGDAKLEVSRSCEIARLPVHTKEGAYKHAVPTQSRRPRRRSRRADRRAAGCRRGASGVGGHDDSAHADVDRPCNMRQPEHEPDVP